MFGCPISSRYSPVRRVVDEAPISGQIGIGNYRDGARVASRGWKRSFDTIQYRCRAVARSSPFEDAGNYITKLPKKEIARVGPPRLSEQASQDFAPSLARP